MNSRIGVIAIIVEHKDSVKHVNELLSDSSHIILGRMGVPYKEKNISVMSILVDGNTDDIGALTGKLGRINGVNVKSVLTKK